MRCADRRAVLVAIVLTLLAFRGIVLVEAVAGNGQSIDISRFFQIAHSQGRPYVDYAVEYPPVLIALVKFVALIAPDRAAFGGLIVLMAMLAELSTIALVWRVWGREAAVFALLVNSALIGLFIVRLDLVATAFATGAVAAGLRGKPRTAALLITTAVGLKLWPLPIAALLATVIPADQRRRYIASLGIGMSALAAVWLGLGGLSALSQVVTLRGAQGWEIESVVGSLVRLVTREAAVHQEGALRFGHVPALVAPALLLVAGLVCVWAIRRVRTPDNIGSAWVVTTTALIAASTLFSPQFVAWLVPGAAIAWKSGQRSVGMAVAAVCVLTLLEDAFYPEVVGLVPGAILILLLRNFALIFVGALALRQLEKRSASRPRTALAQAEQHYPAV
jgi:hypothetical protein